MTDYCINCSRQIHDEIIHIIENNSDIFERLNTSSDDYYLELFENLVSILDLPALFKSHNLPQEYYDFEYDYDPRPLTVQSHFYKFKCGACKIHSPHSMDYIDATIKSIVFNYLTHYFIYIAEDYYDERDVKWNTYKSVPKFLKELLDIYKYPSPKSHLWLGSNYYCEQIIGVPIILYNIGIPRSHYEYRKTIAFDDIIAGHPKASNGWCKEAMDNIDDLCELKK